MPKVKTLLWIDDERFALIDYKTMLEAKGFTVLCAYTLSEGLEKLEANHKEIDLVILDIMLDIGNISKLDEIDLRIAKGGYESGIVLGMHIRRRYPDLPILVYSFYAEKYARDWFEEQEIRFFSKKESFETIDDLIRVIEEPTIGERGERERGVKDSIKAFIVHGHDEKAKLKLKNYLQNTLKLREPVILHETSSLGRTLIEKFEVVARDTNLVFVLLTPDDVVCGPDASDEEKRRARQNVIFELGYFLGKLGRKGGRVLLLHKGKVELPSDISGLVYIDISHGIKSAGEDIRRELLPIIPDL